MESIIFDLFSLYLDFNSYLLGVVSCSTLCTCTQFVCSIFLKYFFFCIVWFILGTYLHFLSFGLLSCVLSCLLTLHPTLTPVNVNVTDKFTPTFSSLGNDDDTPLPEYQALLESCQYSTLGNLNQSCLSQSNLLVLHLNIRSLPKNFDVLEHFVHNLAHKPYIIIISETWLDAALASSFNLDGYSLETSSQPDPRGKGSAIYIRNSVAYRRRGELESSIHQYQSVFLEFKSTHNQNIILGAAYRSPSFPSSHFVDYLDEVLVKINNERKFCLIGGDFNIDILKHHTDDSCSNLTNLLSSSGFFPCICLPTRITSHSSTLIDNFFCNDPSYITSPAIIMHDISDHLPISIHIKLSDDLGKSMHVKHHNSFDFRNIDTLKRSLVPKLQGIFQINDAEAAGTFLSDTLREGILNYSIKKVSRRSMPFQPWISYGLLRCINKKITSIRNFFILPLRQTKTPSSTTVTH